MGSRGSVIPFFLNRKNQNTFPITDINMTRFNITLMEGVNLVLLSLKKMWGGEIFVPKIPSYRLIDLTKAISPKAKIKIIGVRPGEKLHEEMISQNESINAIEFRDYYVIIPNSEFIGWNKKKYLQLNKSGKDCRNEFSYDSKNNKNYLNIDQLKKLIQKNQKDFE